MIRPSMEGSIFDSQLIRSHVYGVHASSSGPSCSMFLSMEWGHRTAGYGRSSAATQRIN